MFGPLKHPCTAKIFTTPSDNVKGEIEYLFTVESLVNLLKARYKNEENTNNKRWFHPYPSFDSHQLLSQEEVGTYLVRPSSKHSKSFALEIKNNFTIEKMYIRRQKDGRFSAKGLKDERICQAGDNLCFIMEAIKKYFTGAGRPFKACSKPYFNKYRKFSISLESF